MPGETPGPRRADGFTTPTPPQFSAQRHPRRSMEETGRGHGRASWVPQTPGESGFGRDEADGGRMGGSGPVRHRAGMGAEEDARLNILLSYAGWQQDSWADHLPRLLEPMGVRSLRAGSGRQASEVIRQHPVHIAVVDLGLPLDPGVDSSGGEGGPRLLELLQRLDQPPPTVVVKRRRTARDDQREIAAALRAGAFAVVDRPLDTRDLEVMLEVLRRCLRRYYSDRWPDTG